MPMFKTIFYVISLFFCILTRLQIGLEDANHALRDLLYWLYLAVLYFQGINCIVLLFTHKCNFTYGHKKSTAFLTPIFTKLTQCHYVKISCTDFHQCRTVSVRGMDISSCMCGFHCADFHGTRNHPRRAAVLLCGKTRAVHVRRKEGKSDGMWWVHWWSLMLWGHCSTGISFSRTND